MIFKRIVGFYIIVGFSVSVLANDINARDFLPLSKFEKAHEEVESYIENDELYLTSKPQKWSYIATAPLHGLSEAEGRVDVLITFKVLEGTVAFGILNRDRTDFIIEQGVNLGYDYMEVHLYIPTINNNKTNLMGSDLIVRTWADDGKVTKVKIKSVEVIPAPDGKALPLW